MGSKKIDIAVGGYFHADRLALALQSAGHDLRLLTTFPASRFPENIRSTVRSFLFPEVVYRGMRKLHLENPGDHFKMWRFGNETSRWIGKTNRHSDLFIGWSSFCLEALRKKRSSFQVVIRDSAHISRQTEILTMEYQKYGIELPNRSFCIERELEEYELADSIWVLSEFAKKTFIEKGFSDSKLHKIRLGADLSRFKPDLTKAEISLPLKVIYFGNISLRKGIPYLLEGTKKFKKSELTLTLVGSVAEEMQAILSKYPHAKWVPAMKQEKLAEFIRGFDVFVFPTLEDGFGMTLPQAMASGLIPLVTDHCGAAEIVDNGKNGMIVAAANSRAIEEGLESWIDNLAALNTLRNNILRMGEAVSWSEYDRNVTHWVESLFAD